ncbi:hypothetical protein FIBSPDRAFT_742075, partial [Athelia psychrophila]
QPSIYSAPETQLLLQETHSPLEGYIAEARRQTMGTLATGHAHVQGAVDRWIGVEHAVESRVKSLLVPEEPLTPGILYVAVAALTGSVLARSHALPIRVALPPLLLCAASAHFLPKTSHNIATYAGELEERYAPRVKQFQDTGVAHTAMTWAMLAVATKEGREQVGRGTESLVGRVQERTGLKLRETLGWSNGAVEKAKEEVGKAVQAVEATAGEAKKGIDAKIEQAKGTVDVKVEKAKEETHPKHVV